MRESGRDKVLPSLQEETHLKSLCHEICIVQCMSKVLHVYVCSTIVSPACIYMYVHMLCNMYTCIVHMYMYFLYTHVCTRYMYIVMYVCAHVLHSHSP